MKKFFLPFLCLLQTSCMVGPNYHRPYIDIPYSYDFDLEGSEWAINTPWWQEFNDPVLVCLIEESVANNKDLRIAAANIQQAVGQLIAVRSQLFPQIGYNASGTRIRESETNAVPLEPFIPNPQNAFQAEASFSWNLDLWGRIRRQVESAQASLCSSVQARQDVLLNLVSSVANAYLFLRGLDEQLDIAIKTANTYHESLVYFQTQFEYGQVSKMNVAQAASQYESAASTIPEIQLRIVETENAISILLGSNPGPIPRGKTIEELSFPPIPEGIPSDILCNRPDVRQAEFELMAANADIGAAKALYFPDISLTGAYGGASKDLGKLFNGPSRTWDFAGSIVGPIFTFGSIRGQVQVAEATRCAALYNYEATIQNAFREVEDSLAGYEMLSHRLSAQKRLVEASGEYVYLAKLQYDGGYTPYFTVLQAEEKLFPAELSLVQTRVDLFTSLVDTYRSLGGGWVVLADQARCCTR